MHGWFGHRAKDQIPAQLAVPCWSAQGSDLLRLGPGPVMRTRCPSLLWKQWDVPCPPAAGLSGLGIPSPHYHLPLALQPLPELHPGQEQPEVCRHAHHPDHLHQQPQPHGFRLQAGESGEGLGWLWTGRCILMYHTPGLTGAGDAPSLPRECLGGLCDECPPPCSPWG